MPFLSAATTLTLTLAAVPSSQVGLGETVLASPTSQDVASPSSTTRRSRFPFLHIVDL